MVIVHFTKHVMLHLATVVDMPNDCLFKSRLLWWNRVARLSLIFMTDDLLTIFIHRSPERYYWCWITWFGCGPTGWVLEPRSLDIHICAHFFDPANPLVNQTASPKMIVPHHIPLIYVKHILKSMINHDWLIYGYITYTRSSLMVIWHGYIQTDQMVGSSQMLHQPSSRPGWQMRPLALVQVFFSSGMIGSTR